MMLFVALFYDVINYPTIFSSSLHFMASSRRTFGIIALYCTHYFVTYVLRYNIIDMSIHLPSPFEDVETVYCCCQVSWMVAAFEVVYTVCCVLPDATASA